MQAVQEFFLEFVTYFSPNFSSSEIETVNIVPSHITSWKSARSLSVEVVCLTIQRIGFDGETDKRDLELCALCFHDSPAKNGPNNRARTGQPQQSRERLPSPLSGT